MPTTNCVRAACQRGSTLNKLLTVIGKDLRLQLAEQYPSAAHWILFDEIGEQEPPMNQLCVTETFAKFVTEFLPLCPIKDPRGQMVKIRRDNFPKFLNLTPRPEFFPRKPSTIVQMIETGKFVESEYAWQEDRIKALFWVPDVISKPAAIYRKRRSHGIIPADEVYVKVYNRLGSKIKLVFANHVGRNRDTIFITSFLTSAHTAMKYCDGPPLYSRK